MRVSELMSKCVNCDYSRTIVTIRDGNDGQMWCVPNAVPEYVKAMYVRSFRVGQMRNGRLVTMEIAIEGRDKL